MTIIIDFQPVGRKIEVESGITILRAAQNAGIGLSAICGGQSSCGTCLVRLKADCKVSPPTSLERKKISQTDLDKGHRLACQTTLLESATIDIPPESLTAPQRTQVEGIESSFEFDPAISYLDIAFTNDEKNAPESDWDKLNLQLKQHGFNRLKKASLKIMQQLPVMLRSHDWKVKIVFKGEQLITLLAPGSPLLGLAVDIGTTKIAGYLIDLFTGKTLVKKGMMNPQIAYGEDIMARIAFIMSKEQSNTELQTIVVESLNKMAQEMCLELNGQIKDPTQIAFFSPIQIVEMTVVGNSAMHHIFLGLPVSQLGTAPYLLATSHALDIPADEIGLEAAPGANIHLLPNIAGFVGADHVAMLLAAEIGQDKDSTLYIDIGTNTEITLSYQGRMISCSAASGPAFEGAHIGDGMRAAEGAIERVRIDGSQVHYQTIGNVKPVGICGSGILDAVAQMINAGILNRNGTLNQQHPLVNHKKELIIASGKETQHQRDIVITRKDVSEIQLAKGAIRAAIELLLKQADINFKAISTVKIAGAFGSYINIASAKTIGLFPGFPESSFKQLGNAAGTGARQSLLSVKKRQEAQKITDRIEYLELSTHPDFTAEFAKALNLAP